MTLRILTLDLGSGSLKACLWNDGVLVTALRAKIPQRIEGDIVEQSAEAWWEGAVRLVREMDSPRVDAIGVTGLMHAVVPVTVAGDPLAPVAVVPDRRARRACREIDDEFRAARVLEWTGGRLDPTCVPAKLRHFQSADHDAWRVARWVLPPKDYMRLKLTGATATDPIDAAGTMLYDIRNGDWHADLSRFVGVDVNQLPQVLPTVSIAGTLSGAAAELLGLTSGIPVAVGGGDDIETLGAGLVNVGDLFEHFGTTGSVYVSMDRPRLDPQGRIEIYPDVVPERWLAGGSTSAAGSAILWGITATGKESQWAGVEEVARLVGAAEGPSGITYLPYLSGERAPLWDPNRTGAYLGLRQEHGSEDLQRATLEGVLFSLSMIVDVIDEVVGSTPGGRVLTSGPIGSLEVLGQVRADIYEREIIYRGETNHTTSFAAMVIADCALSGRNPYQVADRLLPERWRRLPKSESVAKFRLSKNRFRRSSDVLAALDGETAK